jgi:hypothetical protein
MGYVKYCYLYWSIAHLKVVPQRHMNMSLSFHKRIIVYGVTLRVLDLMK